jgi:hypothetical protein
MNMRCSNRWAKPVRPGFSSFEPTWYQTFTTTSGLERSWWRIKRIPFGSTKRSKGIDTSGLAACDGGASSASPSRASEKTRMERDASSERLVDPSGMR